MLVSDIMTQGNTIAQEAIVLAEWVNYINDCLDDVAPVAKILVRETGIAVTPSAGAASITIATDTTLVTQHEILNVWWTQTTPTAAAITQLRRLPLTDLASLGWVLTSTTINLQGLGSATAGTVNVDFYQTPQHIALTTDTPPIPAEFHKLLINYGAYRIGQRTGVPDAENDFFAKYQLGRRIFAIERIWQMEPWLRPRIQAERQALLTGVA